MTYYRRHVFFCVNQRVAGEACCNTHCAQEMRNYAKKRIKELGLHGEGKIRVNNGGCMDRCEQGPIMVIYPDAVWYTYRDKKDVDEIIHEHLINGRIVARLKI